MNNVKQLIAYLKSIGAANVDTWERLQQWIEAEQYGRVLEDLKSRTHDCDFACQLELIAQSIKEADPSQRQS